MVLRCIDANMVPMGSTVLLACKQASRRACSQSTVPQVRSTGPGVIFRVRLKFGSATIFNSVKYPVHFITIRYSSLIILSVRLLCLG